MFRLATNQTLAALGLWFFFNANQGPFSYLQRPGVTLGEGFEPFSHSSMRELPCASNVGETSAMEVGHKRLEAGFNSVINKSSTKLEHRFEAALAKSDGNQHTRNATLNAAGEVKRTQSQVELAMLGKQLRVVRMDRLARLMEAITPGEVIS